MPQGCDIQVSLLFPDSSHLRQCWVLERLHVDLASLFRAAQVICTDLHPAGSPVALMHAGCRQGPWPEPLVSQPSLGRSAHHTPRRCCCRFPEAALHCRLEQLQPQLMQQLAWVLAKAAVDVTWPSPAHSCWAALLALLCRAGIWHQPATAAQLEHCKIMRWLIETPAAKAALQSFIIRGMQPAGQTAWQQIWDDPANISWQRVQED